MSRKQLEPEDLERVRMPSQAVLSPNGQHVAWVIERVEDGADTTTRRIYLIGTEAGAEPRIFTRGKQDHAPAWSPDGRTLGFVSTREGSEPQIHLIDIDGGEARPLTHAEHGVSRFEWSPDGARLLFSSYEPVEQRAPEVPESAWAKRPQVIDRLAYKTDGVGYSLGRRSRLFVADACTGEVTRITAEDRDDTSPAWCGNDRIVFVRAGEAPSRSHLKELWICDADGGHPQAIAHGIANCSSPSSSPDGRRVAFYGNCEPGNARDLVWCVELEDQAARQLARDLDRSVASVQGQPTDPPAWIDNHTVLVNLEIEGNTHLFALDVDGDQHRPLVTGERQVWSPSHSHGRVSFAVMSMDELPELYVREQDGSERRLSQFNSEWAAARAWPESRWRTFRRGDTSLDGWVLRPAGCDQPTPLYVEVHGGPQSIITQGFALHPAWYVLTARGWSVLLLNARGSTSYGTHFAERVRGAWGEHDLDDHLAVVDELVREGLVDPTRVAIGGKSYGGYMAAWAIGQTDRFCAAIVAAPVTNLESHYGTSDSGPWADASSMAGDPWQVRDTYRRLSPVQHAHRASTPTLLLQGDADERCPQGQSEELFNILVRVGRAPVEMVWYPGGSHHFPESGLPSHRVDYVRRTVEWCERWAQQAPREREA